MFDVEKIKQIIAPSDLPGLDGKNINGPTCIRVPSWCENQLAKYYLYFAHHSGKYIRMCYSNSLEGEWTHFDGGVLSLEDFNDANHHIASPEIYVNSKEKLIYLYFHSPSISKNQQWTFLAISKNGINFDTIIDRPLAPFYMRVFQYSGYIYGMVKGGSIWKSQNGTDEFKFVTNPFNPLLKDELWFNDPGSIRHVGLYLNDNRLHVFFSRIGDMPERIMHTSINLSNCADKDWIVSNFLEVIRPDEEYEGAKLSLKASTAGAAHDPMNELRDPYVIYDSNIFNLFYSVAGEQGIAISKFKDLP